MKMKMLSRARLLLLKEAKAVDMHTRENMKSLFYMDSH